MSSNVIVGCPRCGQGRRIPRRLNGMAHCLCCPGVTVMSEEDMEALRGGQQDLSGLSCMKCRQKKVSGGSRPWCGWCGDYAVLVCGRCGGPVTSCPTGLLWCDTCCSFPLLCDPPTRDTPSRVGVVYL